MINKDDIDIDGERGIITVGLQKNTTILGSIIEGWEIFELLLG